MEFRDLKEQYKNLKNDIDSAVFRTLESGQYIMGEPVLRLEKKLSEFVGTKHCITCANGTDALSLVLSAWGIGVGDAVFVPDFTFFATGEVVSYSGATPVFVDVDRRTFNIDSKKLEEAILQIKKEGKLNAKVIIPVDLFGLPADYKEIEKIGQKYDLLILEDGAQGFGGQIGTKKACSFGNASTTSFFPAKPLGCYGDGGAIFTNDDKLSKGLRSIKFHGKGDYKYDNVRIGVNSRLDTLQAALLLPKFEAFKSYELNAVNQAYQWYTDRLNGVVITPFIPKEYFSSFAQYTILLQDEAQRNHLQTELKKYSIPTMIYYPKPMHLQIAFNNLGYKQGDFPVTEWLCKRVLSLPMHPYLKKEDVYKITDIVKDIIMESNC